MIATDTESAGDNVDKSFKDAMPNTGEDNDGNFWKRRHFVNCLIAPQHVRNQLYQHLDPVSLDGVGIAVLKMPFGGQQFSHKPEEQANRDAIAHYQKVKKDLQSLGAIVVEIPMSPMGGNCQYPPSTVAGGTQRPGDLHDGKLPVPVAQASGQSLHDSGPNFCSPCHEGSRETFARLVSDPCIQCSTLHNKIKLLEGTRRMSVESWLLANQCDLIILPTAGWVAVGSADVDHKSADQSRWRRPVCNNGGCTFWYRELPTVTVPLTVAESRKATVGLPLGNTGFDESNLIGPTAISEMSFMQRNEPKPALPMVSKSVTVAPVPNSTKTRNRRSCNSRPDLVIEKCISSSEGMEAEVDIHIEGYLAIRESESTSQCCLRPTVEVFVGATKVDGNRVNIRRLHGSMAGKSVFDFTCSTLAVRPQSLSGKDQIATKTHALANSIPVVIIAREGVGSRPVRYWKLL